MSVTIKEIARHTGLSIPTVGNVLGRSANRYSLQTRQRVMKVAQELGYKPNSSARAIREGRFGCAALVLSRSKATTHSYIPLGLLDGVDEELARHNMHLNVSWFTDEELSTDEFLPKVVREHMADGMIINYTHEIPPRMLGAIHAHHAPAVWVNAKLDEDCVYPDDYGAAKSVTRQLIQLGHRRIAFLHLINPLFGATFEESRPRFHYSVEDRARGYREALQQSGLSPRVTYHDRFVDESDHLAAYAELLRGPDRPTAVLCYSDNDLSGLMCVAASMGLSIPRDLSVLAFYPTEPWAGGRRVSAVQIPSAEIGRRAVRMLLQKMKVPDQPCPAEVVQYQATLRETVAPPTG